MNASGRPNTCKLREKLKLALTETGARVRNAYATYLLLGNSPGKLGLIPHSIIILPGIMIKDLLVNDGHAYH